MKSFATVAVLGALAPQAFATKCTALVMSGGGSNGAWEAGVFWGLLHYGNPLDYRYDVITGVSAGAINTGGLAGWAVGDEYNASQWLSDTWNNMKTSDVWQYWETGLTDGFNYPSFVNTAPGLAFLKKTFGQFRGYKRKVSVASVDAGTGEEITFDEKNTTWADFPQATLASSSVPGIFPPQYFKGRYMVDGMTAWNTNVESAIQRCKEVTGGDESLITVDIMICGYSEIPTATATGNTIDNYMQARRVSSYNNGGNSITEVKRGHPKVHFRHLFEEKNGAGGIYEIKFEPSITWRLQQMGRDDAKAAVNALYRARVLENADAEDLQ